VTTSLLQIKFKYTQFLLEKKGVAQHTWKGRRRALYFEEENACLVPRRGGTWKRRRKARPVLEREEGVY
jgi:hypothetical protein